jgi:hypothetical protein
MDPINFIVVCTENYSAEYANKSLSMFKRNFEGNFTPFCITDKKDQISEEYNCIEKQPELSGWWNKLSIFNQILPHEYTFYVDLDLLIMNPLTEVLEFAHQLMPDYEIACFGDHVQWHGEQFGSAFMYFEQKKMYWIYEEFIQDLNANMLTEGGDQIWLGQRLEKVLYLERHFNNLVKSLKIDLGEWSADRTQFSIPQEITRDFILLNFHGKPKPQQLLEMNWRPIQNIWY